MSFNVEFKHSVGESVKLKDIDRPGVVTGVLKDSDGCQYRVVWWDNASRKSEWLNEFEIESK